MCPRKRNASLPTSTDCVVLCLLALRDWSAPELADQVQRSLRYCWPRTDRLIYVVPKRLVAQGLAAVRHEPAADGKRARRVYAITDAGRAALDAWRATEPAESAMEFEAMVRLSFADQGTKEEALAAIDSVSRHAEARYRQGLEQMRQYLDDGGPFPERLHLIAITSTFHAELLHLLLDWAERARTEVASWPKTEGLGMTSNARQMIEHTIEQAHVDLGMV